jgi:hypothetical protein
MNTSTSTTLYFFDISPVSCDRTLVSNTFTIDNGMLEKTLEFALGEWLLSIYTATSEEKRCNII